MSKFSKTPLTQEEKAQREKEFLRFDKTSQQETGQAKKKEKEPMKGFLLRLPESYFNDLDEISLLSGISKNAICLELLRPALKKKLRELQND